MNNQNKQSSRAHRRPDTITEKKHTQYEQVTLSDEAKRNEIRRRRIEAQKKARATAKAAANEQKPRQNPPKTEPYKFTSGRVRSESLENQTLVRDEGERRLQKYRHRREIEQRKEAKWQKDIVRVRGGVDMFMLAIILLLVALGSITVFSASYPYAIQKGYAANYYMINQIKFVLLGCGAMTVMLFFPVRWYKGWAPIVAYIISAILLVVVLFIGTSEGEAVRWIDLGFFNIQPSELMKISVILMLAWYVERYEHQIKDPMLSGFKRYAYNVIYPCIILGGACLLVMIGKHLSGTIIVGAIGFFMLIVAGSKLSWLMLTVLPAGAAAVGIFLATNPYAMKRITSFTDENADKLDEIYQTTQSIYAIGSGGLFGVGFGHSRQKYSYLGAAHTDFIFSVWCEELGFIGAVLLIVLFLLFVWRGYVIAVRAPDKFTMLTAFGITTHVGLQAMLNMCVASDIIMNTGITLPFFSYGGSSLVVLMAEMGILLCISRQYYRKREDIERDRMEAALQQ